MTNSDLYASQMAHARDCEAVISAFQTPEPGASAPLIPDFSQKTPAAWLALTNAYQEAFAVYCTLNQMAQAQTLWTNLFNLFQTFDLLTSNFGIHLLLSVKDSYPRLVGHIPGLRQQLNQGLRRAMDRKLTEHEMDFWLLLTTINFVRDLADDEAERRRLDHVRCQTLVLGAQLCFHRGNEANAEMWQREAAQIALDRLGDGELSSRLLEAASHIGHFRRRTLHDDAQDHLVEGSDEDMESTPLQPDLIQSLEDVLHRSLQLQHQQRFLPPIDEIVAEYAAEPDKFEKLIKDERFTIQTDMIDVRARAIENTGLLSRIPVQIRDSNENVRGWIENRERFILQAVGEIAETIAALFQSWQASGYGTEERIIECLSTLNPTYRWDIYRVGVSRYIQGDFISAIHVMIPQFENILRGVVQAAGVPTKKVKNGIAGEKLLNDLVHPNNAEVQQVLGRGFYEVIYWYFVNSTGPLGYRSKVAHGWIRAEGCTIELTAMIIWATMRVCAHPQTPSP